jgi:hypothetical protein
MKMKTTILVVGLGTFGFLQAMAQSAPARNQPATSATIVQQTPFAKQMPKMVTPFNLPKTGESSAINRVGGISSQPWAVTAERQDETMGFPNNETPEPRFNLLSVNLGPGR